MTAAANLLKFYLFLASLLVLEFGSTSFRGYYLMLLQATFLICGHTKDYKGFLRQYGADDGIFIYTINYFHTDTIKET